MHRTIFTLLLATGVAGWLAGVPSARAQGNPPGTVSVSAGVTGIGQGVRDLDAGGDLRWGSLAASASVTRQFVPAFAAGLSLRYDAQDWRLRAPVRFGGAAPWAHLNRPGASLNLSLALSRTTLVRVSPTVEWAYDSRAAASDGCVYGAVLSGVRVFSPRFVLGAGASVTRQFYSVKTSPFVIVNWQLAQKLRIANAAGSGPLGGAGVELRYAPDADWEFAAGGVSRSDRWRIAERAPAMATVAETSSIPLLARVSRRVGAGTRLDLYGGVLAANRVTLRDSDGHDLGHDGYGAVPLFAAAWSVKY